MERVTTLRVVVRRSPSMAVHPTPHITATVSSRDPFKSWFRHPALHKLEDMYRRVKPTMLNE